MGNNDFFAIIVKLTYYDIHDLSLLLHTDSTLFLTSQFSIAKKCFLSHKFTVFSINYHLINTVSDYQKCTVSITVKQKYHDINGCGINCPSLVMD